MQKLLLPLLLIISSAYTSYAQVVNSVGSTMVAIAIVDIYSYDYDDGNNISDEIADSLQEFQWSLDAKSQETTNKVNYIFNMERFVITGKGTDISTVYRLNKILDKCGLNNQEIADLFEKFKQSCNNGSLDKDLSFSDFYGFIKETIKLVEKKDRRSNFKDFLMPTSKVLKKLLATSLLDLDTYEKETQNFTTKNNYENELLAAKDLYYLRETARKYVEKLEQNAYLGVKEGYHDLASFPKSLFVLQGRYPEFLANILEYNKANVAFLKDVVLAKCGENSAFVILVY